MTKTPSDLTHPATTDAQTAAMTGAGGCLSQMRDLVARMGGITETQVAASIAAMLGRDNDGAQTVIANDADLDALEAQIEQLMQSAAHDGDVTGADWPEALALIRIAADLERIGDFAKNISKRTLVINSFPAQQVVQGLGRMMRAVQGQLGAVLDALSATDSAKAKLVWGQDGTIDEMNNALFQEITSLMMARPDTIKVATHFLFIAKNLERIGDHCTNIAELVYFNIEGTRLGEARPKADRTSLTLVAPYGDKDHADAGQGSNT